MSRKPSLDYRGHPVCMSAEQKATHRHSINTIGHLNFKGFKHFYVLRPGGQNCYRNVFTLLNRTRRKERFYREEGRSRAFWILEEIFIKMRYAISSYIIKYILRDLGDFLRVEEGKYCTHFLILLPSSEIYLENSYSSLFGSPPST